MMFATHPLLYPWTLHPAIKLGNMMGKDPLHERFGEAEVRYEGVPPFPETEQYVERVLSRAERIQLD